MKKVTDLALLDHIIDELTDGLNGGCLFWACPGPEARPVQMATCRACWAVWDLKTLRRRLRKQTAGLHAVPPPPPPPEVVEEAIVWMEGRP